MKIQIGHDLDFFIVGNPVLNELSKVLFRSQENECLILGLMSAKSFVFLLVSTILLIGGCIKNEYVLDENTVIPGLEPEFAIPLANSDIGMNELIESLNFADAVQNVPGSQLALTFKERLFEIGLEDLVQLPPQEVQETYEADAITAALFNATLEGTELPITQIYSLPFEFEYGEELDSIRLG
ncbi:MAG: hypothetical protein HKO93_02645, partial [Flavobacteriales bacterium]|nr:hypothetical protein [Flavobacteriales bacterium]